MSKETFTTLLHRWIELWNGNVSHIDEIIAPNFVGHFPPTISRQNDIHGSQALKEWIQMTLALFIDVQVTLDDKPIIDDSMVVGRWLFRGTYQGGVPEAKARIGTQIAFNGIDILRIADDKIVEYWVSSDSMYLMQQLGVIA